MWAQAMAAYHKVPHVLCYSGGTEATALYPMVIKTLAAQGFDIYPIAEGENPIYAIHYSERSLPLIGFSKKNRSSFKPFQRLCGHYDLRRSRPRLSFYCWGRKANWTDL